MNQTTQVQCKLMSRKDSTQRSNIQKSRLTLDFFRHTIIACTDKTSYRKASSVQSHVVYPKGKHYRILIIRYERYKENTIRLAENQMELKIDSTVI